LELEGYNGQRPLLLPVDRHRSPIDQRSSLASVAQICFDNDVTTAFVNYASSHQVTHFQLGLAIFYAFLYKLTHGQNDLCIACLNANRYRTELQNMIGMFVATLPYRIQLDSQWPFDELVKHIQEKCLSILEHSHYPLQRILTDSHLIQSSASFLETAFDFISISSDNDQISFDGASLEQVSCQQWSEAAKFDFMFTLVYNPTLDDGRLSYRLMCSRDLYDETTVETIARRLQHFFFQFFSFNCNTAQFDQSPLSINEASLILPEEANEMQRVLFRRLPSIRDEGMFF
jgi:non-ribosomal peptide synthetase component F